MKREVTTCDVCKKEFNPGKGINLSIVAFWERAVERDVCSFACLERCAQIEAERVRVREAGWYMFWRFSSGVSTTAGLRYLSIS